MADPIVSPVTPAQFKELIPSASGSLCQKIQGLLRAFPEKVYDWFSWKYNEDGSFTDDYKAMLCELGCTACGSDDTNPDGTPKMPTPNGIQASDGAFDDHVHVVWNAVVPPTGINPVTLYKIYRSLATNTDPTVATLIASVAAPTLEYDDYDVIAGTTYNYWVVATNGTDTSGYGGPDVGNSATAGTGLDAPSIEVSTVLYQNLNAIVFATVTGADSYIIYRATMGDFSDQIQINTGDETPNEYLTVGYSGAFYLNKKHSEVVYIDVQSDDNAIDPGTVYYYRVKAKRTSPPTFSDYSNDDTGVFGYKPTHTGAVSFSGFITNAGEVIDTSGQTNMYVVLTGCGGGGAGGGPSVGGGGGGGPGIVFGEVAIAGGSVYTLEYDPDIVGNGGSTGATDRADHQTDGAGNFDVVLKKDGVEIMRAAGGSPGLYNNAGSGAGGAAGSGTVDTGEVTDSGIIDGREGKAAITNRGGYSGYAWGSFSRTPACNRNGGSACSVFSNGDGLAQGGAGSGCDSENPSFPTWAVGGYGHAGHAYIVLHS